MDNINIFHKLEGFLKEPINIGIINILMRSGFDSKLALLSIKKSSNMQMKTNQFWKGHHTKIWRHSYLSRVIRVLYCFCQIK